MVATDLRHRGGPFPRRTPPWAHLERLTKHPQLFLSAADQIGSGVALVAREDLTYLVVNEAMGRIDGVAVEDHVGRAVPEVLPAAQWRWLEPLSRRVFAGEEVTSRYTDTVDGGLRVVDVRLAPVREEGEVAAMLVVVTDVSVGETVRRHSDQLLVLALELNLAESLGEVAEAVAAHSRHCFGAVDTGLYWRCDPQSLVRLSRETSGTVTISGMERVGLEEAVPVAHVVKGRRALWLEEPGDWSPYPAFLDPVAALGWPVVGVIPLGAAREVRGALYLTFAAGRQVPDHERQAVQTLAALCAAALERLVRAEEARAVADRLHLTRGRLDRSTPPERSASSGATSTGPCTPTIASSAWWAWCASSRRPAVDAAHAAGVVRHRRAGTRACPGDRRADGIREGALARRRATGAGARVGAAQPEGAVRGDGRRPRPHRGQGEGTAVTPAAGGPPAPVADGADCAPPHPAGRPGRRPTACRERLPTRGRATRSRR